MDRIYFDERLKHGASVLEARQLTPTSYKAKGQNDKETKDKTTEIHGEKDQKESLIL